MVVRDDHAIGFVIEQVADRLHLGQDQPALGRFHVDGDDQHGHLAGRHQIAQDCGREQEFLGRHVDQGAAQFLGPLAGGRRGADHPDARGLQLRHECGVRLGQIAFVERHDHRQPHPGQLIHQGLLVLVPGSGFAHQHRHVEAAQQGPGLSHPQIAQFAGIVEAGGIEQDHRTDRQQFHGLLHGIGGGAGHLRHYRQLLPRHRVEQRRLADVAAAQKPDMQALSAGGSTQFPSPFTHPPDRPEAVG